MNTCGTPIPGKPRFGDVYLVPAQFSLIPPFSWLLPIDESADDPDEFKITYDFNDVRNYHSNKGLKLHPRVIGQYGVRPAVIITNNETIDANLEHGYLVLPLFGYNKGVGEEAYIQAGGLDYALDIPRHPGGCSLTKGSFISFTYLMAVDKHWFYGDAADSLKTDDHKINPVCQFSHEMIMDIFDKLGKYFEKSLL